MAACTLCVTFCNCGWSIPRKTSSSPIAGRTATTKKAKRNSPVDPNVVRNRVISSAYSSRCLAQVPRFFKKSGKATFSFHSINTELGNVKKRTTIAVNKRVNADAVLFLTKSATFCFSTMDQYNKGHTTNPKKVALP